MERPLDQIFLVKSGQKGPDFGFGHFSTVKSWNFSIFPKIDFFWPEWPANWFLGSFYLIFMDKTLKLAGKSHFWSFLAIFVIFDRFQKRQKKGVISDPKSTFCCWFIKYTYKSPPGSWELNCKCLKICRETKKRFWKFFATKNLVIFVPEKCIIGLSVSLKS